MAYKQSVISDDITFEILTILSRNENLQVAVNESIKSAAISGSVALISGLLFGRIGFTLGGALGGIVATTMSSKFVSVVKVLQDIPVELKSLLCHKCKVLLRQICVNSIPLIMDYLRNNPGLKNELLEMLKTFITSDLRMVLKA